MYDFSREKVHKIVRRPEAGVELYRMIATAHVNDYLQMACLSLDLGSLPVNECAQWLSRAIKIEPDFYSVLRLV